MVDARNSLECFRNQTLPSSPPQPTNLNNALCGLFWKGVHAWGIFGWCLWLLEVSGRSDKWKQEPDGSPSGWKVRKKERKSIPCWKYEGHLFTGGIFSPLVVTFKPFAPLWKKKTFLAKPHMNKKCLCSSTKLRDWVYFRFLFFIVCITTPLTPKKPNPWWQWLALLFCSSLCLCWLLRHWVYLTTCPLEIQWGKEHGDGWV